jgi:hypothetical protein
MILNFIIEDASPVFLKEQPRPTLRKPEDVKFRTQEEEKAARGLQDGTRRDMSAEPIKSQITIDDFEILGLIGEGSYGKVFLA